MHDDRDAVNIRDAKNCTDAGNREDLGTGTPGTATARTQHQRCQQVQGRLKSKYTCKSRDITNKRQLSMTSF
jgi:hypothetical protein